MGARRSTANEATGSASTEHRFTEIAAPFGRVRLALSLATVLTRVRRDSGRAKGFKATTRRTKEGRRADRAKDRESGVGDRADHPVLGGALTVRAASERSRTRRPWCGLGRSVWAVGSRIRRSCRSWSAAWGDNDPVVRLAAHEELRRRTGQDFGYVPWASAEERTRAIDRWRGWLGRGTLSPGGSTTALPPLPGKTLPGGP